MRAPEPLLLLPAFCSVGREEAALSPAFATAVAHALSAELGRTAGTGRR